MVLAPDFLLDFFDFGREEFDRTAALSTHHVMVRSAIVLVLVARHTVVESDLTRKPTFSQQLEGSIDSSEADVRILLFHQTVKFIGREVISGFQEGTQDRIALLRMFQANAFQVLVKNVLRLAHHLARNGGLIVYAFGK